MTKTGNAPIFVRAVNQPHAEGRFGSFVFWLFGFVSDFGFRILINETPSIENVEAAKKKEPHEKFPLESHRHGRSLLGARRRPDPWSCAPARSPVIL
jgi:hypothetical protein